MDCCRKTKQFQQLLHKIFTALCFLDVYIIKNKIQPSSKHRIFIKKTVDHNDGKYFNRLGTIFIWL